jgi:type II secretory pathway component GspD/PulD (secretin)
LSQSEPNQRLTITLTGGQSDPDINALAMAVRVAARIRDLSIDESKLSITFGGVPAQLDLVRSLVAELDRPSHDTLPANPGAPAYPANDGSGHVGRVLYLHHAPNPMVQQETMSSIRTVVDLPAIFPYWPRRALVVRGTPQQMELAEWLVGELDRPAGQSPGPQSVRQIAMPGGAEFIRVFFLNPGVNAQQLQQKIKALIAQCETRRVFPSMSLPAVTFRGTAAEIRLAEKTFVDQP